MLVLAERSEPLCSFVFLRLSGKRVNMVTLYTKLSCISVAVN